MSKVIVSHGLGADQDSVWFPYLRTALSDRGHEVAIPRMPDSQAPRLEPWLDALATAARAHPAADTVLVGHSIGSVNILRLLEQHDAEDDGAFAGVVLVASPSRSVGYNLLEEFFAQPFDWERIRRAAGQFRLLTAIDDPVLAPEPIRHVEDLVTGLGATAVVTASGGHFGATPSDHVDLPEAVRLVLDCLKPRD